jgi:hypothetical protein
VNDDDNGEQVVALGCCRCVVGGHVGKGTTTKNEHVLRIFRGCKAGDEGGGERTRTTTPKNKRLCSFMALGSLCEKKIVAQ